MRHRKMMTISFEDEAVVRDELRALAEADAGRSVGSVIRAAVHEYLAKRRQESAERRQDRELSHRP
jgi:hypothetical protein